MLGPRHGPGKHLCSVCITPVNLVFISVCFSVCLNLTRVTNAHHCQPQHYYYFYLFGLRFTWRPITC